MVAGKISHSRAVHPDNPKQKARNKKEAEFFESIAYQRAVQNIPIFDQGPAPGWTIERFIDEVYLPFSAANHRSHRQYIYFCKVLKAAFGGLTLADLSPFQIEKFKITQAARGVSGNTIRLYLAAGSDIFTRAQREGLVGSNPFRQVAIPEIRELVKRRLSREEEARLLVACQAGRRDHLATAIILMVELGPRPSELFNLKTEDIEPGSRMIRFRSYKTGRRRYSHQSKDRWIPATARAWAEIQKLQAAATDGQLFPFDSVKKAWAGACKDAGVEGFWFRWLRDEAASRWAEAGAGPYEIAYLLGHADVVAGRGSITRMSMIYVKPMIDRLRVIMEFASDCRNIEPKPDSGMAGWMA